MEKVDSRVAVIFREQIKSLKQMLPKECTFLAPKRYTDSEGKTTYELLTKISGEEYTISIPQDLSLNGQDISRIQDTILQVVSDNES